jgi:hypothetical protein
MKIKTNMIKEDKNKKKRALQSLDAKQLSQVTGGGDRKDWISVLS